jgi:hypothetical protein
MLHLKKEGALGWLWRLSYIHIVKISAQRKTFGRPKVERSWQSWSYVWDKNIAPGATIA